MIDGGDPHIHAAFLRVFEAVCDESFKDLLELCHVSVHDCGNRRINVDDKLDLLRFILLDIGYEIMKNGREHIVFVVADCLFSVDLGIIEDIADLVGNLTACVPYRDEVALDLAVLGLVDAETCKSYDRVDRGSQLM